jgi:hypothetical protein
MFLSLLSYGFCNGGCYGRGGKANFYKGLTNRNRVTVALLRPCPRGRKQAVT